ncbi:MAG: hypothetical protein RBS17_02265 [Coriobacteriia bacterium]|nr:hypothetical protein [Coriobacteriia bacterium]
MSEAVGSTAPEEQTNEQPTGVQSAPTDDTAPMVGDAPVVSVAADAALLEGVGDGLTWIPFGLYLAAWIALATATVYSLRGATAESPARWMPEYPVLLWAGVVLAAAGPILSLGVWLVTSSRRAGGARRGLLVSAMTRGALAAAFGVMIWLGTLYTIEIMTMNGALA